jgi:hypothetical protein
VAVERTILGSTIVFAPFGIDEALEGLAAAGYTRCEIGAVKGWFEHIDPIPSPTRRSPGSRPS